MRFCFLIISISFLFQLCAQHHGKREATEKDAPEKEAVFFKNIHQLTSEGKNGEAYFSWDKKKIVFQSVRGENPWYQIYSMNLDGSSLYRISPGKGKTTCAYYQPKGDRLLFASTHLEKSTWVELPKKERGYSWDFDPYMDIFAGDEWGNHLVRLTDTHGYDAEGSYSPDGKWICFTSDRSGDKEIYIMDSKGKQVQRLTYAKGYDGGPFFSPDGKKVIFRGFRDPKNPRACHVYIIDRDGKNEVKLTTGSGLNWCPYFHPSGDYIIYSGMLPHSHNFELFLMSLADKKTTRLTFNGKFDGLPVFSPDGKKLMWTSNRVGNQSQLFIADFVLPGKS